MNYTLTIKHVLLLYKEYKSILNLGLLGMNILETQDVLNIVLRNFVLKWICSLLILRGLLHQFKQWVYKPRLVKLHVYTARVPMSMFHPTFLEAVWPIRVVWNGFLITVEITDSTVCPHYDTQKLKCIKHSNLSSCRWEAGASRVQRQWLPAA